MVSTIAIRHPWLLPFLAALTLFLSGCAVVGEMERQRESRDWLARGGEFLVRGDYQSAVRSHELALSAAGGKAPADQALFELGLLYTDPENRERDHEKAQEFFRKLIGDFPQSPLAGPSSIWVKVLEDSAGSLRERHETERANAKLWEKNHELARENRSLAEENQDLSRENQKLSQENAKLSQDNQRLKKVLDETKRVDLEIEQKKKETQR